MTLSSVRLAALLVFFGGGAAGLAQAPAAELPSTLTLPQALRYALEHYPSISAATDQAAASQAEVAVARSAFLPRLDSLWQANRATVNNTFGQVLPQSVLPAMSGPVLSSASDTNVWGTAAGALFSWEAIDLGLRGAVVREAEAGAVQARANEAVAKLAAQQAAGLAFLSLVNAQQAVAAADADVARRDVLLRAVRTLVDNQLRPGAEATRMEAELAAARTRALQARQAVAVGEATLARHLGVAEAPVAISGGSLLVAANIPPQTPAAGEHPFLLASQAAVDLARAREGVLARTDRPRVLLQSSVFARGSGANIDGSADGGVNGLGFERANWAAGVQVVFPNLFGFAGLQARRSAAAALTRAERARDDETRLGVVSQQRTSKATVETATAIAANTPVQLAAAQQSEAQARARYEAGLTSIIEVAEAQTLLAAAEFQHAAARLDVWRALLLQAVAAGDIAPFLEALRAAGVS